jgi:DNA-binding response OmpR family regulator
MRVLIVEDDALSRRILEKLLSNWGYSVTACENGRLAWEQYQADDFRLVISDWMMPEMDGVELCRRVREHKRKDYCYFMMLTTRAGKENFIAAMDAGADDYLLKPLDAEELKARLRVAARILALQSDLQTLRGILPICAWCKKIRDDDSLWHSAEQYLATHTRADLSHSICPDCREKMFDDFFKDHDHEQQG